MVSTTQKVSGALSCLGAKWGHDMGKEASRSDKYTGEIFRFHFDPSVADRLNYGRGPADFDVRRDWKVIINKVGEVIVSAGAVTAIISRDSIVRIDYTNDLPPNKIAGTWPGWESLWAVPALEGLVAIEFDQPVEVDYARHPYLIRRMVLSVEHPDHFIALLRPARQESVGPRPPRRDDAPFEDWKPPYLAVSLEELWIDYVRRLLGLIERWTREHGMPTTVTPYVDFSTAPPSHVCREKPWYGRLLQQGQAFLFSMPELDLLAERLIHDGILETRVVDADGHPTGVPSAMKPSSWLIDRLTWPVIALIQRWGTFDLTDAQILQALEFYREAWTASMREYFITVPLLRLTSDIAESRPLPGGRISIAPFTAGQKERLWNRASFPDTMELVDFRSFTAATHTLVGIEALPGGGDPDGSESLADVRNFVTALRLDKAGDVGVCGVFSEETGPFTYQAMITRLHDLYGIRRYPNTGYDLPAADLSAPLDVFTMLQALTANQIHDVSTGLRHFNQSYARDLQEDRIIDLTISLESTILFNVRNDQITSTLARRGRALCARMKTTVTTGEAERFADFLKAVYEARSRIVHGGATISDLITRPIGKEFRRLFRRSRLDTELTELPFEAEEAVRLVLRTYITLMRNGTPLRAINTGLDAD